MKRFKGLTKWLGAGVLALALTVPAGAVSAASVSPTVHYQVYYYSPNGNIDWNTLLQHYFQGYYPVVKKPVTRPPAQPAKKPAPAPAPQPVNSGSKTAASGYAQQVVSLVNQERAKASLHALASNAKLSNMAMVKAQDMKNKNYFDHNSPTYGSPFDMMKQFGITYRYAGENIAMGQRNPKEVMTAWMNSPGHKANILNKNYTSIGVAYYNGEWVQEFIG